MAIKPSSSVSTFPRREDTVSQAYMMFVLGILMEYATFSSKCSAFPYAYNKGK